MSYKGYRNEYNPHAPEIAADPYLTGGYMIIDPVAGIEHGVGSRHDIEWYPDRQ